jgi:hypothetical protein
MAGQLLPESPVGTLSRGGLKLSGRIILASRYGGYFIVSALTLTILTCTPVPTFAQKAEKWRPKDRVYMTPGKNFDQQCGEFGNLRILLRKNDRRHRIDLQDPKTHRYRPRRHSA